MTALQFTAPHVERGAPQDDKEKDFNVKLADHFVATAARAGAFFVLYQDRLLRYDGERHCYRDEPNLEHIVTNYLVESGVKYTRSLHSEVMRLILARSLRNPAELPELPMWLGEQLTNPRMTIAFENGLLDMEQVIKGKVELIPHSKFWFSEVCLPYDFDPAARCPRWLEFLGFALDGDAEKIALLQEWFGYCLIPDNSLQKMLVLKGLSGTGKGTTATVLQAVVGQANTVGYSLTKLGTEFGLGCLVGKLVARVGEVNLKGDPKKNAIYETLLTITGNDPVTVNYKGLRQMPSIRLVSRFVITCNEFPYFGDSSSALDRRLSLIEYNKVPKERDPDLANKLCDEVSGIANWAITGLQRLMSKGDFTEPTDSVAAKEEILRESNLVRAFAQDRLSVATEIDPKNIPGLTVGATLTDRVAAGSLGAAFEGWCKENHYLASNDYFLKNLATVFPNLRLYKRRHRLPVSGQETFYYGIKTKELSM